MIDLRLNLGAGDDRREGYINVDLRADVADLVADVRALPVASESVAGLLALDLLEHFGAAGTQDLLAEWHRVLIPGGTLTVKVPNLAQLCRWVAEGFMVEAAIRNIYGGHRWGPDGAWDAHHTGWVPDMLHAELEKAGFEVLSDDLALNNTVEAKKRG